MKKTVILLSLVILTSLTFAQKGKVTSALSLKESGKITEALENINIAIDPNNEKSDKTLPWPKTWEVRGEIYQAIFKSEDPEVKSLAEDPLTTALESYKKALELDEKGRFENNLKIKLTFLMEDLSSQAVQAWNDENFELALKSFEKRLEINDIDIIKADNPNLIDTAIIFNAGLAAYNGQMYEQGIKYFKKAAETGYNGGRTYLLIASSYKLNKDTVNALASLEEGVGKYPDDSDLVTEMLSIYLQTDKKEEAMKYLQIAMEKDPNNPQFHFIEGTLNDNMGDTEAAIESYKKSLEIDDAYFNSYYNLGALYFNKGVEQHEIALKVPANDNEKYQEEIAKCDQWWDKALPPMEKCLELMDKGDQEYDVATKKSVFETLKNIYYRMIPRDEATWKAKYDNMTERINSL